MSGARHWWLQRITAVILIPLTVWFVFAIRAHITADFAVARAWLAEPLVAVALIIYLTVLFFHAQLGLQVIVEDYVAAARRGKVLLCIKLINIAACAVAIFSVLRTVLN